MDLQLAGRVVIITGGASGIGRATADYFRREGARLVLADLQPSALRRQEEHRSTERPAHGRYKGRYSTMGHCV